MAVRRLAVPAAVEGAVAIAVDGSRLYFATATALHERRVPASSRPRDPLFVALGDSWALGTGASSPDAGHVRRTAAELRRRSPLELLELAQAGAQSPALIEAQVPAAATLLRLRNGDGDRRDDVRAVTLDAGGADVLATIQRSCAAGVDPACRAAFAALIPALAGSVETAFGRLRAAAGPGTPIVVTTYATGACPTLPGGVGPWALMLEGDEAGAPGLHDVIRAAAARNGIAVADVASAFGPGDWAPDCLHPNDSGHAKLAAAVLAALADRSRAARPSRAPGGT